MKNIVVLLADGFEELEAFAPVDLLRRAGAQVQTLSITDDRTVKGARDIVTVADGTLADLDFNGMSMLVLPGGYLGSVNVGNSKEACALIECAAQTGKTVAAICGAPSVLGKLGLLKDKTAACYPGMEEELHCKTVSFEPVVQDGNIITSRGAGTAVAFGLKLVEQICSPEKAKAIAESIVSL